MVGRVSIDGEVSLLSADAVEVSLAGRTGVYDIVVTNQDGVRVALVRGRSSRLRDRTVMPPGAAKGPE